jgi:hypothetical protein
VRTIRRNASVRVIMRTDSLEIDIQWEENLRDGGGDILRELKQRKR